MSTNYENNFQLFQRLKKSQPEAYKKIVPLHGDVNTDGLGLNKSDLQKLIDDASVVFHFAATLKLEAKLKDAIEQNTAGTQRVIDVAKQIKNLKVFIHLSTAFCSADIEEFEEKVSTYFKYIFFLQLKGSLLVIMLLRQSSKF